MSSLLSGVNVTLSKRASTLNLVKSYWPNYSKSYVSISIDLWIIDFELEF